MLVCNVSLRPPRIGISANLAEMASATDATATGNIVFAALVDDPASVRDRVDAYSGEIMREAASANATVNAGLAYGAGITAAVTAQDSASATVTAAPTGVTWDPATAANVTLSGGNLVVTNTNTVLEAGAHVASTSGKTSGKYYFEVTSTVAAGGGNMSVGIGTPSSTFTSMGNGGGVVGDVVYTGSGSGAIWANGSSTGAALGTFANGTVAGMAVDLDNRKIWFRKAPSGNWNNSGTANPATNVGGITIPAGTMVPFVTFGGAAAGFIWTANFGASAFTGAVPSGFTSGWI